MDSLDTTHFTEIFGKAAAGFDQVRAHPVFERVRDISSMILDAIEGPNYFEAGTPSKVLKPERKTEKIPAQYPFDRAIEEATGTFLTNNVCNFITYAPESFAYLENLIKHAKKRIYLRVSSFADDSTGQRFGELLLAAKKANPNLDICVQVDKLGCFLLDSDTNVMKMSVLVPALIRILIQHPEIKFAELLHVIQHHHEVYDLSPEIRSFLKKELHKFLTRDLLLKENKALRQLYEAGILKVAENDLDEIDHSKSGVVDNVAVVKGANIGDSYSGGYNPRTAKWGEKDEPPLSLWQKTKNLFAKKPKKMEPWQDFMAVAQGPAADILFQSTFGKHIPSEEWADLTEAFPLRALSNGNKEILPDAENFSTEKQITWALHYLIDHAESEIVISHAYLLDKTIIGKLKTKAQQGVKIKIAVGEAENEAFGKANGAAFQELACQPNVSFFRIDKVIHAKAMMVDGKYLVMGSANFSHASLHQHSEIAFMASGEEHPYLKTFKDFLSQFPEFAEQKTN